jgi:negative regulator of flagellin synthesis FlgM
MDVQGIGSLHGAFPVKPVSEAAAAKPAESTVPLAPQDEVEISSAARLMQDLEVDTDLRSERLAQIKAAIDDGTYETEDKLKIAVERLLESFDEETS